MRECDYFSQMPDFLALVVVVAWSKMAIVMVTKVAENDDVRS